MFYITVSFILCCLCCAYYQPAVESLLEHWVWEWLWQELYFIFVFVYWMNGPNFMFKSSSAIKEENIFL